MIGKKKRMKQRGEKGRKRRIEGNCEVLHLMGMGSLSNIYVKKKTHKSQFYDFELKCSIRFMYMVAHDPLMKIFFMFISSIAQFSIRIDGLTW